MLACLEKVSPATMADLARSESTKPQSMGTTVAPLEEMGLIQRSIELTAKGAAVRNGHSDAMQTWLAQAISRPNARER